MDENYLDNLLAKAVDNSNNDIDKSVDIDSGIDLDVDDLGDISFEELDDLDGLDLSDLELDDIDFDDIDVMKLDHADQGVDNKTQETEEDFSLDELISEDDDINLAGMSDPEEDSVVDSFSKGDDVFSDADNALFEDFGMGEQRPDENPAAPLTSPQDSVDMEELFGGSGDNSELAGMIDSVGALDDLLSSPEPSFDTQETSAPDTAFPEIFEDNFQSFDDKDMENMPDFSFDTNSDMGDMNIDDLFSALGIDGDGAGGKDDYTKSESELDAMIEQATMNMDASLMADIEDRTEMAEKSEANGKKKRKKKNKAKTDESGEKVKKTFSEILFGVPDEDDLEEAKLLQEKKEQKLVKKEEVKAKKEEKKSKKAEALALKKENAQIAKLQKAEKKKAQAEADYEEDKDSKPVSTAVVIIVFLLFALIGSFAYFGSQMFHYSEVVKRATDYFERQRYRLAYDEVSGVNVKKKDADLRDSIYTVMYVERLYESYENNIKLGRADKALDALLRGLEKYDEHYEEAVELDIVDDIDSCKEKIVQSLSEIYKLTESDAKAMLALEGKDYLDALNKCCDDNGLGE